MPANPLDPVLGFVTRRNVLVVVLLLAVTAGVVAGIPNLQLANQDADGGGFGDTTVAQKQQYIDTHYDAGAGDGSENVTTAVVYVRDEDGNVLSKDALLDSLRYQRAVRENESVAAALLADGGTLGVANLVATRAAGVPDASLDAQIAALEGASEDEVHDLVAATLAEGSPALRLLPAEYEPGSTSATSRRMLFRFDGSAGDGDSAAESRVLAAQRALYDRAATREAREYFTLGPHAAARAGQVTNQNTIELIVPAALLAILAVLAFSYRDLVDVVVGFVGVVVSLLWMFGILGWLGVAARLSLIIGPVLVVGLSVDYGLHVFMRYREERGDDEGVREPMRRSLSAVGVALALVTATTAVGFLSNVANELSAIRSLAIGITLGVVSAFVVFVTLVPALKVTVDSLLERLGLDRRKRPLGKHGALRPALTGGVAVARRAAPVVIAVALLAGAAGAAAWTGLDRQAVQQQTDDVAQWKQDLPEPFAWHVPAAAENGEYVAERYRAAEETDRRNSQVLVEGDVTAPGTLERLHDAADAASREEAVFVRAGTAPIVSPLSVMRSVAETDGEFAGVLREADTDGNGVPDRNLVQVYDALYDAAPQQAARVVERSGGQYRSVRMVVPIRASATLDRQATAMHEVAATAAGDGGALTATAVGRATLVEAEGIRIARNILTTLIVALTAVFVMLLFVYRVAAGSASLGAVTAVPIALVTALVIGGMYLLDVPLTLLTALLLSLIVGLGVDYNIHVSERFARELDDGRDVTGALREALSGTGGALLGSTLTSTGAFSALLLHPHPQLQSFGTLVVLALVLSFAVSVFVLPSLLVVWARYADVEAADATGSTAATAQD